MTEIAVTASSPDLAQTVVRKILSLGVDGIGPMKGAERIAAEHLGTHGDVEVAIGRIIKTHIRLVAGTGFVTGLGGFAVAAVTIPADITALYATAARCAGAIAVLRGYDVRSEEVRSVILLTLIGSAGAGVIADVGAEIGTKAAIAALKQLPGHALIAINKAVGFRLITAFGTHGAVNLVKFVPVAGGIVGAGVNVATIRTVARYAKKSFPVVGSGD